MPPALGSPDPASTLIPLKPVVFHVLLVLMDGEAHGYHIVKRVEERTEGELRIEPANLYRSIRWMVQRGLVRETVGRPDSLIDDQRRRYFEVTPLGVRAARAEAERMRHAVALADSHNLLA